MKKRLKNYLFRRGWKQPRTIPDKILYILNQDIDLKKLYSTSCYFVYVDVNQYIEELESIMEYDFLHKEIELSRNLNTSGENISFLKWMCPDNRVLDNPIGVLHKFLLVADKYLSMYQSYSNIRGDGIISYNTRILKLHSIYLTDIVNVLYNIIET